MSIRPAGVPLTHLERLLRTYPWISNSLDVPQQEHAEYIAHALKLGDEEEALLGVMLAGLSCYVANGRKHFVISEELVWLLSHTEPELTFDELRLPFDVIYLSLEGARFRVEGEEVHGVYALQSFKDGEVREAYSGLAAFEFWVIHGINGWVKLGFRPDKSMTESPLTASNWMSDSLNDKTFDQGEQERLINLALNSILYICTPSAVKYKPSELVSDKQRKKAEKSAKKKRQLERLDHNTIILGPRTPSFSRSPHQGGNVRAHLRRGHWRKQWVGTRRDELGNRRPGERQVPVWVMPAWVSGADEPTKKTTYISL